MILLSLLLAVTLGPAFSAHPANFVEGAIQARPLANETTCKPGHICASAKTTLHGCFVVNFWNGTTGGTPLAIDITQTGSAGTTTWVYWVNNTNQNIGITGNAQAKYYCPTY